MTHAYGSPKLFLYRLYTKKYPRSFGVTRSNTKVKFQTTSNSKTNDANMLPLDKHAKVFTVTSSFDLRLRGQRSKKVKFQTTLNGRTNGVNMLALDNHAKVFTVTCSSNLRLRGQRSKKVKFQTTLNGKTNGVNMLALGKHAKVSTMTSLSDLRLRGQRSKKVKFQIRNQYKDVYQCVLADTDLQFISVFYFCIFIRKRCRDNTNIVKCHQNM